MLPNSLLANKDEVYTFHRKEKKEGREVAIFDVLKTSAGILEQSMGGGGEEGGLGTKYEYLVVPARQVPYTGGIDSWAP